MTFVCVCVCVCVCVVSVFFFPRDKIKKPVTIYIFSYGLLGLSRVTFLEIATVTQNCLRLVFQKVSRVTQTVTGYFFKICHGLHNLWHGLLFTNFSSIEMQAPRGSFCLHEEFMFLFKVLFRAERGCPRVARVYIPLGRSVVKKKWSDRPTDRPTMKK